MSWLTAIGIGLLFFPQLLDYIGNPGQEVKVNEQMS
jgi:hypothetical protein